MTDLAYRATADVSDEAGDAALVADPMFTRYGARERYAGRIATLKIFEDNKLVRTVLSRPGQGRVLVVDGGGSRRCALVGDNLAKLARDQGWAGIVVFGCIRDTLEIGAIDIGIHALGAHPKKTKKRGEGIEEEPVTFAGVTFCRGDALYADSDGIVVIPAGGSHDP
ncbi:MAG: ribonuclease E activity regulator RraA [Deltaproteobacteria bacterium]